VCACDAHEEIAPMMLKAIRSAFEELECSIAGGPIVPDVLPHDIREHLASRYDFTRPMILEDVCGDLEDMLRRWQVQVTHPRYFGLFNPSVTLASVVAETFVAMYNPQLATWRTSPAANEIERHTLAWLAAKFGFPRDSVGSFTSGGSEANLSAVTVAMTRRFPEYGNGGLRCLTRTPTIYLSDQAHNGFNKIAQMTGLGRSALRPVAIGPDLRMSVEDLARRVAEDRRSGCAPLMVVATAGTTSAGVIDPLGELARFCQSERLWFHVDAAWGGAAILSPRLRTHLAGIESADSVTCDAHKWLSVPMGAGMFFCRHRQAVVDAFRAETSFMPAKTDDDVLDPHTSSVEWSRRFMGLKLFLALAQLGEQGYVEMIEHQSAMGDLMREMLQADGWRIVNSTPLPLVCFTRDGLNTRNFLAALYARQIAWMSEVRLNEGVPVLRACITSFRTGESDIRWVMKEMNQLVGTLS
jgi:glutamate/tyrosine decarboxylase-like PLP-dependent enzyme